MNCVLLRLAIRDSSGVRRWSVPGAPHQIVALPSALSSFDGSPSLSWPHYNATDKRWVRRSARIDWHSPLIKKEIRQLIKRVILE